ncbi:MAG: tRNA pseudouridine(55) synthase TruB [Patescibacteria group bacterium]|jgi:tRNA pseudouridine55 synthase|nr:tRNA pseudouridine(55) synthase TruB [Patescibacteria group bacterium]
MDNKEGIYLIDKPANWTSFDVVAKVRSELRKQSEANGKEPITKSKLRVGHAGTLDPFATGLLIILVGTKTKKQNDYMKLDKEYIATLFLGAISTTGDPEGIITSFYPVIPNPSVCHPRVSGDSIGVNSVKESRSLHFSRDDTQTKPAITKKKINEVLSSFIGEIEQIPPQYSAIKINGQRAYELARKGEKVELKPRKIKLYDIEILSYKWPMLKILVNCSSGTYIRALAEDIGKSLGCGAYLTALRRTKIGNYSIDDAKKIESIQIDH